jgi:cyclopropane-fatty-acyl-phospholipid synthase
VTAIADRLVDSGRLPPALLRRVVRANIALRHARLHGSALAGGGDPERFVRASAAGPIALETAAANAQHYEVPVAFFRAVLGPRLKYSSAYWPDGVESLADAEEEMLRLTCERAGLEDGMSVLDLGCGWGSLSFWILERYPAARIVAVTNSRLQAEHLEHEKARRPAALAAGRLEVVHADVNDLELGRRFDRVVSVEMVEHVRNHRALNERVAAHLAPDGAFFVHHFAHRRFAYAFDRSWMARRFFSAGTMPSHDLLDHVRGPLRVEQRWVVPGAHYARTARAWRENLEARPREVAAALAGHGDGATAAGVERWRVFFLACEELFAFRGGTEWHVSHVTLRPT